MITSLKRIRQTKILATLGPSSNTKGQIRELFETGADLFRLNFSHGTHEDIAALAAIIREIESEYNRLIGIVADLQGPKLRIGTFEKGRIELERGDMIRFDSDPAPGDETRVYMPHPEIFPALKKDGLFFIDDGKTRCRVREIGQDYFAAEIRAGGTLSDKKGFNVPETFLPIPALTDKDKKDIKAALEIGVDWIAQSFVQTAEDVKEARKLIGGGAALMVKLEKPAAIQNLEEIVELADGVMLARGDLGVEIPPEDVPSVQKRVVRYVHSQGKPVVVATQMLESMIASSRPTRAEASDVATAVYDGADAVMLSAETAAGQHPVKSVEMMDRICARTESDDIYKTMMEETRPDAVDDPSDAITSAAFYVAHDINAACIVTYTASGSTALRMARQRPDMPVLCLTPHQGVARRMVMSYGVHAVCMPEIKGDFSGPVPYACKILQEEGLAEKGQRFVMTAGVPFGVAGTTNILRIAEVE
ncbi:MAG: pyruvate kinase [Rhodospirillales bacterium]|nr:pyruvate kinase [Rhodospirillales bacterium]